MLSILNKKLLVKYIVGFIAVIGLSFSFIMVAKKANAKKSNSMAYENQVLPVKYGNKGDLMVYFVVYTH